MSGLNRYPAKVLPAKAGRRFESFHFRQSRINNSMKLSTIMEMRRGHVYVPVTTIDRNSPMYKKTRALSRKIQSEIMDAPTPLASLQAAQKWKDKSGRVHVRLRQVDQQKDLKLIGVNADENTIAVAPARKTSWNMKDIPTMVYDINALSFNGRERLPLENATLYTYAYLFDLTGSPIKSERVPNPSYDKAKVDATVQKRNSTLKSRNQEDTPTSPSKLEQKYGRLRQPGWDDEDDL